MFIRDRDRFIQLDSDAADAVLRIELADWPYPFLARGRFKPEELCTANGLNLPASSRPS